MVDARDFLRGTVSLRSIIRHAARSAVRDAGERLFLDCYDVPPTAPYRTGRLRSSGSLHVDGRRTMTGASLGYHFGNAAPDGAESHGERDQHVAVVRFDAPYAAITHESVSVHFKHPGSGPKYLESKIRNWPKYLRIISRYLAGVLR